MLPLKWICKKTIFCIFYASSFINASLVGDAASGRDSCFNDASDIVQAGETYAGLSMIFASPDIYFKKYLIKAVSAPPCLLIILYVKCIVNQMQAEIRTNK